MTDDEADKTQITSSLIMPPKKVAPEEDHSRTIIAGSPVPTPATVATVPPVTNAPALEADVSTPPQDPTIPPGEDDAIVEAPVTQPPKPLVEVSLPPDPILTAPPIDTREVEVEVEDIPEPEPSSAPAAAPMPTPSQPASNGSAVPIGTVINNNYAITQLISAGGMGEVFRGENTFTGDAVAIKIVLQSLAHDEKIAALFKREAKVLCGLSDQSIVRYYNFVRDAELDRFCLIMEFIDGIALSDHVKEVAPLTREEGHRLLRRLAGGLARAHAMDVVHRDLSPDNVMLRGGFIDEAVLIDFGIAKSSEMAESTLHGQLAGKFKYISPEQLGHFGGEIGPRTDIYGLGLLMAAALRGEPIDMGSSIVEAVDARRGIPDVNDIDAALRPLIAHMLEPNPVDRPASMADVITLLDSPETIPEKYGRAEGIIPPGNAAPVSQSFVSTTGLQSPPGSQQQTSGFTQQSFVPGGSDTSQSPFGGAPVTQAGLPLSQPGQTLNQPRPVEKKSGGVGGAVRWLILLGMIGAGGYYLSQNPDLIFPTEDAAEGEPLADEVTQTPQGPQTRGSFLAGFHEGACGFAERISAGPQAGTIATYSADPVAFDGMIAKYETLFDTRPAVQSFTLDGVQCPVADLAKVLAKRPGTAPILILDSNVMESGGSIVGRLSDRRGRPVWLALITTQGGVYNLTDRLTEQADGSATFSFALNAPADSDAQPQVLVAIASDAPLIAAAASTDGASAASVMPLIEAEIVGKDGAAKMTLGYFDLKP
jgi:serine/threonine protein kinase